MTYSSLLSSNGFLLVYVVDRFIQLDHAVKGHELDGGKCLVRDSKGEELEVYEYELSPIPLSKELLEYLGFRFDKVDYKIKGCKCYKLTKVIKKYFTLKDFIEAEEPTTQIGCIVMSDGEVRFSVFTRTSVDGEIGSHWVDNLNKFLYLCECVGYRVKVDIEKLNAFMLV